MNALFITHDCCIAGAQHSFLRILRWFRAHTAWRIGVLALGDGPLAAEFARLAPFMLWRDLPDTATQSEAALARVAALTGGMPDVIFGNTVVSAKAYELLSGFGKPMITRIAELGSSVDRYATPEVQAALLRHSTGFVAVSAPVADMLRNRFGVPDDRITVINGAIEDTETTLDISRRAALPMPSANPDCADGPKNAASLANWPILWGCGSISHRKGADLFLHVAEALLAQGITGFRAFWAGHPEDDLVRGLFLDKERSPARNHVTYLGKLDAPAQLMAPGDIFLMTSREDPFPLVSLEAAERGVPTVCFPGTGGIPDFAARGGGMVAQQVTAQAMTRCLAPLLADRTARVEAGKRARATVLQHHTMAQAGPRFARLFDRMAAQAPPRAGNIASSCITVPTIHVPRATRTVSELLADTTAVVRTVGERTTDACLHLLRQILPEEHVHVIREVPFSRAVRRCFEIGIEQSRKWTLVIDADVLVRAAFVAEVLLFADRQQANTFVVQGLVHDKLFNLLRPAGNHLYRTKHLPLALALIPEEGNTLRPEATTIDHMVERGFLFFQKDFVVGLHDYGQHYVDIAKKCFVQSHKHERFVNNALPRWQAWAERDPDFRAAIIGAKAGRQHRETVYIDNVFLEARILADRSGATLGHKEPLEATAYDDNGVVNALRNALDAPDADHMQTIMFPPQRWNHIYGNGSER
ncbi:glycosyltransferase family 4 protein [Desulfomicrobium baculatum]|uniref:Glycosyl transferase group 1 n=1 Tax=Desulfomicrobium baculatum (strain DSM 4028 / VKM B-1378 / X) TaxID=525897 RepID=C7LT30_DESBD|nr:glycosyltransferase family 4 protein [Desulfomicrobium baculatum]ACU88254.1 glycosyl transferase group 1 [Desulfomicrobium baculatum DSM 4028]